MAGQLVRALWKLLIMVRLLHGVVAMGPAPGSWQIWRPVCSPVIMQRRMTFQLLIPGDSLLLSLMVVAATNGTCVVVMHRKVALLPSIVVFALAVSYTHLTLPTSDLV